MSALRAKAQNDPEHRFRALARLLDHELLTSQGKADPLQMAQSTEPKTVHDLDPIWRTVEALEPAPAKDRGKAGANGLVKWKETCMIEINKQPDTDVALTARPARSPVR